MKRMIDEDTTQNDMSTILHDLTSNSQGSQGGEGRREEGGGRREEKRKGREGRQKKMLRRETKVTLI